MSGVSLFFFLALVSSVQARPASAEVCQAVPDLGQMLVAAVPADHSLQPAFTQWINSIRIGTLLPNGNAVGKEAKTPGEVRQRIESFYDPKMDPPPWIVVDQEGGDASQFKPGRGFIGFTDIPSLKGLAKLSSEERIKIVRTQAQELKAAGVNWVFAPVVDLDSDNPVIGKRGRAASTDPKKTAEVIAEVISEFKKQGLMATAKHYPGHGSVPEDSHLGLATSTKTWEELKTSDLIPFQKAIDVGVGAVMTGHIQISGEKGPASLSSKMVQDRLRGEMGYQGLIVTDGLWMKGVGDIGPNDVGIKAIEAGNDILTLALGLDQLQSLYNALCNKAVADPEFKKKVQASIARVKKAKAETFKKQDKKPDSKTATALSCLRAVLDGQKSVLPSFFGSGSNALYFGTNNGMCFADPALGEDLSFLSAHQLYGNLKSVSGVWNVAIPGGKSVGLRLKNASWPAHGGVAALIGEDYAAEGVSAEQVRARLKGKRNQVKATSDRESQNACRLYLGQALGGLNWGKVPVKIRGGVCRDFSDVNKKSMGPQARIEGSGAAETKPASQ